ncbi:hypothetical protein AWW67_07630 [Roseivirga seohaensis]|uniref:Uncharacterized protein n=2 Tax=Roseivirga seohaensis TaxID=1914963 RepID=A0A150XR45_9BACT|nr:hypothetical protein AWW67_07630 [Roseivirga seohaensis]
MVVQYFLQYHFFYTDSIDISFVLKFYICPMWKKACLSFFIVILALSSCQTGEDPIPAPDADQGKSYFFMVENKYREYNVREIRYSAVDISDTLVYQLREEVHQSFVNSQGEESRIIHRLTRDNDTQPWVLDSVWTARIEKDRAVSIENNISIVKMVFPSQAERVWDGNIFNTKEADQFKILNFGVLTNIAVNNDLETTSTMTIEQENDEDGITFRNIRREIYADSIGLISKLYNVVKICSRQECLGEEKIESGRFYRETIYAHGFINE